MAHYSPTFSKNPDRTVYPLIRPAKMLLRLLPQPLREELRRRKKALLASGSLLALIGSKGRVTELLLSRKASDKLEYSVNIRRPRSFNEKVQWRKLHDRRTRFIPFVDKVAVRDIVASWKVTDLHLPERLWSGDRGDDIPFDSISPPYIIKTNRDSGGHWIVRDAASLDRDQLRREVDEALNADYGAETYQWLYSQIEPQVLIEGLLLDAKGCLPNDYKFYCFDGEVRLILATVDMLGEPKESLFDQHWNRFQAQKRRPPAGDLPKPENLEQMLVIARSLSSNIDFVRIDLYDVDGRTFFGEFTFYPGNGFLPFYPLSFDYWLGSCWRLPKKREIRE